MKEGQIKWEYAYKETNLRYLELVSLAKLIYVCKHVNGGLQKEYGREKFQKFLYRAEV